MHTSCYAQGSLIVIVDGLVNIIFNPTFLQMTFQCLRRACLIYFPPKWGLYLVLKTRGATVEFGLSFIKCWRSSKLSQDLALEGYSVSTNVSRLSMLCFFFCFCFFFFFFVLICFVLFCFVWFCFVLFCFVLVWFGFVCLFVFCFHNGWSHLEGSRRSGVVGGMKICAKIAQSLSSLYGIWCQGFISHQIDPLCIPSPIIA